ncbi:nonribosomal peptide synthetase [Fusarium denticulatum]|uniref:Nonribosomal peptide synthetase n=1 Tax=Fusarium denticulatum TaxID=48507 RepID=A0A8H5UAJ5_9HYPO|nr:nonribosomal peptide synthetase [Fusarium denticulatum]
MPINSSGQLKFSRVAQWIDKVTDDICKHTTKNLADTRPEAGPENPQRPAEQIISEAVADVINLPGELSLRRSVISRGGDSITAMRVMAHCRRSGVSFLMPEILKSTNITDMAAKAQQLRGSSVDSTQDEDELTPFPLSPIQKHYLAQFPDGKNHYNHSTLLKLRRPISQTVLHAALLLLREANDVQGSLSYAAAAFDTLQEV